MCCNAFRRNQPTETRCSELSLALQVSVVYVRVLQRAFGTVGWGGDDWLYCVVLPSSVLWLREISKLIGRATR